MVNRRPRIAIGGILTECNHFGGLPIDLKTYEENELLRGEEILSCDTSVVGGMLNVLKAGNAEPVPLLYASACAGGPIVESCCHAAGEGAELELALGHKLDPRWGRTRSFTGRVERLSAGRFTYTGGQWEGLKAEMGKTAVFAIGNIRVLVMSRATYDWSDEQFRAAGIDPAGARFIVAKNPMNYRLTYGGIARGMIVLDTPGPTPATLRHVRFEKLKRPYFPADPDVPGIEPVVLS